MSPQLGGIGHKSQDLVTPFCLGEGKIIPYFHLISLVTRSELVPDFHLRALAIRSELVLIKYQTVQIRNSQGNATGYMS